MIPSLLIVGEREEGWSFLYYDTDESKFKIPNETSEKVEILL